MPPSEAKAKICQREQGLERVALLGESNVRTPRMVRSVLPAANNLMGLVLYIEYFECSVALDSDEELPAG